MQHPSKDKEEIKSRIRERTEGIHPPELRTRINEMVDQDTFNSSLLCIATQVNLQGEPDYKEATGIQLLHTGLGATRGLVNDSDSWSDFGFEPTEEDMDILAAHMLVTESYRCLIDHHEETTSAINTFGKEMFKAANTTDPEEKLRHEEQALSSIYLTAVEIGGNRQAPPQIFDIADSMARIQAIQTFEQTTTTSNELKKAMDNADEMMQTESMIGDYLSEALKITTAKKPNTSDGFEETSQEN